MKAVKKHMHKNLLGYLMVLPALFFILLVNIYPMLNGILLTFQNASIYNLTSEKKYVGLGNYVSLLTDDPDFFKTFGFTALYTVTVVFGCYLIGLGLALLVSRAFAGRGAFRTFMLIPWILPAVVAACAFLSTLNTNGTVNQLLSALGLTEKPILFFADPPLARLSVILMGLWKGFPFMSLTLLAGLQAIPRDLYEAAAIDGAGRAASLRHITLPLMKNISMITIMLRFIWTFNNFEQVYLLTKGGPIKSTTTVSIYSYQTAFVSNNLSYAATITITMMLLMMMLIWLCRALEPGRARMREGRRPK